MSPIKKARCLLAALWRGEQGIAAMEFAMVAPMLVLIFLGGYEINRYIQIAQKVDNVAYTVADVVSQQTSITNNQLAVYMEAATQLMQPLTFGSSGVVIVTSVYRASGSANAVVQWRYTGGGTLSRTSTLGNVGATATLPSGFTLNQRDNVIIVEVYYVFNPIMSGYVLSQTDIYKRAIFKPRLGALTTTPI